jgi:hypothetical protein
MRLLPEKKLRHKDDEVVNQEGAGKTFASLCVSVVRIMFRHSLLCRVTWRHVAGCGRSSGRRRGDVESGSGRSKKSRWQLPCRKPEVRVNPSAGLGVGGRSSGSLEL